jgi:Sel1 repeat-containing protein
MQQRFTLDKKSFEEFLAAASFFQQVQRQALRGGAGALHGAQPLLVLMETQRAIELGRLDLDSAMERIVGLTPPTVGASGAGVWLFTRNEFVCGASAGISPSDECLRLQVLSRLICEFRLESQAEVTKLDKIDSGYYPGSIKSLLVTPIYQGSRIAGALAAFSSELAPFTDRDAANLRLLAGLLTRALATAAESGLRQSEALEQAALLQLLEQVTPALRELVASAEQTPDVSVRSTSIAELRPAEMQFEDVEQLAAADSHSPEASTNSDLEPSSGSPEQRPLELPEMEDISVPFIGVRASLGSDVYEESNFWSSLGERWEDSATWVRGKAAGISYEIRAASSGMLHSATRLLRRIRRAAAYRPALPAFPTARLQRSVRRLQSSAISAAESAGRGLSSTVDKLPSPALPRRAVRLGWIQVRLRVRSAWDHADVGLRNLRQRITQLAGYLDVSRVPEPDVRKHLRRVETAVSSAVERSSAMLQAAGQGRLRLRLSLPSITLNPAAVRKSAPAWAVLAIMITFLALELGLLRSWTIAATRSDGGSTGEVKAAAVSESVSPDSDDVHAASQEQSSNKSINLEGSHLKITDPATEAYLSDMTRFETAALRRRAEYGDDIAAFRLGMAYETGHGVPQSCAKAAQWVMQAAEDGNPAAEFNLGLRYRDGDGVEADLEQANKWLRRAFAHRYSGAEGALLAMNSH